MLAQTTQNITREIVEEISRQRSEPKWLLEKRLSAFSEFERLDLPAFSYGMGISLDTSELNLNEIDIEVLQPEKINTVSHENLIVKDLHEALKTHGPLIEKHLFTSKPSNKIHALCQAIFTQGLLIQIPKGSEISLPLQIISTLKQKFLAETILIIAEPFSKASFIETENSEFESKSYRVQNVEIFLKESSKVGFASIQNNQENVFSFSSRTSYSEKDSSIDWNICDLGGSLVKSDVTSNLIGQGASSKSIGVFLGKENQQFDFSVSSIHHAQNTSSEMLTKGALLGKSKTVYNGLIKITPTGIKSSGYQKADVLLLSPDAAASPIPNLEIETNDVKKCTHGATVGQVDKEKLFYLMSRGLSEKEAEKQIVYGMIDPAIQKIKIDSVQDHLRKIIESKLN